MKCGGGVRGACEVWGWSEGCMRSVGVGEGFR